MGRRNFIQFILIVFVVGLLMPACSTLKRSATTTAGAAFGGMAGYLLSDKDPLMTGVGALAGAAVTSLAQGEDKETLQKGFVKGYEKASSDSIKRHYWMLQDLQMKDSLAGDISYYTVPAQLQKPDGTKLVPHSVTIPIVE